MVVNECWLDLNCTKETVLFDAPIVDIECDLRFLRCDIATTIISHQHEYVKHTRSLTKIPHVSTPDYGLVVGQISYWEVQVVQISLEAKMRESFHSSFYLVSHRWVLLSR